ncbi:MULTISPECIES: hypothetical protein [unclassified Salipiger]|uniref:hypothetical protein n=1 Tax=unclassified Salipiger TaxID=2640570 RepID=UPI0013B8D241|nr:MULTISPECIES: hypothetical protein [unclassified Salipiger]NDV49063.1 hypothetical protein [Salipiger sp. PrR003]NDW31322.1 hypothetical protein [Salipiger sp. PrR007]
MSLQVAAVATTAQGVTRFVPPSFIFFTEILLGRTEIEWFGGLQGFDCTTNPRAYGALKSKRLMAFLLLAVSSLGQ